MIPMGLYRKCIVVTKEGYYLVSQVTRKEWMKRGDWTGVQERYGCEKSEIFKGS
jgi:hypothetical protein